MHLVRSNVPCALGRPGSSCQVPEPWLRSPNGSWHGEASGAVSGGVLLPVGHRAEALCGAVCCRMLGSDVIPLPHIYGARIKGVEVFCPLDPPPPYEAVVSQFSSEQVWSVVVSEWSMSVCCRNKICNWPLERENFFPVGCHGGKLLEYGRMSRIHSGGAHWLS